VTTPKTDPYWWEDFAPDTGQTSELPAESEVVVVGAGLTGCSAARTLAMSGAEVVVLDAQRPGFGASTRNGGMIGGGYRLSLEQMTKRYGTETAHALLRESHIDSLAFATALIRDEAITCDFHTYGRFRGQWNKAEYDATARSLDQLRELVPVNIEMIPPERQHLEVGTGLYCGGMMLHDHGGLHPAKYLNGMLSAARRAGARIYGRTPVRAVTPSGSGFQVITGKSTVRCRAVLMATNGYTIPDFSALKRRIIPVSSFVVATEELSQDTIDAIMPGRRMVVETRHRHCYYRLSPDQKRFIIGGRAALSVVPQSSATPVLRGLMSEIFPQLKSAAITHSWQGHTGFTFSFLPHVGQIDGIWHAVGFSGSGNAMAPYLGHKAAQAMIDDPAGETAFMKTKLETRPWYQGRPWFLPFVHALYRGHDIRDNFNRGK
jgi:glycine/D-amino acid oxidase-like deaminating enzyme